jgi:hypothetical protein
MRCLFCKNPSDGSKSIEHIIPESLGNLSHTLPPGVICDGCNNYFAGKVEKPFLELQAMTLLRFNQNVPSKKGNIPPASGVLLPKYPVVFQKNVEGPFIGMANISPDGFEQLLKYQRGSIIFPAEAPLPNGPIVSRFLAKVAFETMAQRLVKYPDGLDYLVDEQQLDPIRNHARRGEYWDWPFHVRRIYDANQGWLDESGRVVQLVHESDILVMDTNEWYFVVAIFGLEFVINYGGPEIEGYVQWLEEHDHISPLYYTKNSDTTGLKPMD